ncbi:DEAD/DEAH box helicase family protein [Herbaspirillum sp. RTI4]|uniref:DEAD/DEAH box helicase family protein n=1 Tax=Herbaspirillum sp. RTI4 TaxID=3048640 RepID=UPI002AB52C78|nr:DEAD/DEAH box helicase family protein [Herbaspirillum sp. RTI4]MDY7579298.1 DEAD/DEAH box helicase family protein [Herbaspirillum sp. RTI4]MEA9983560.1 DEAD/DEAH box helicase family protein [Herbaspirillum sp. RTI4]
MSATAEKHRSYIQTIFESTFEHQQIAARKALSALNNNARAVVVAAEMQSGKSGVALALACLRRLSLSDLAISDRKQLKDTLYLVTMADTALLSQAKQDLLLAPNVVVSNFNHFQRTLAIDFKHHAPKLIIIDECHYGSSSDGVRYGKVFDYLELDNTSGQVVFISATPFSALYAAGSDSILRHSFHTHLVFHKASTEYHGIRQMHSAHQVVKLDRSQRNFCDDSLMRRNFIEQFQNHTGAGWALIRVPGSSAQEAKKILLQKGIKEDQIFILGQSLSDTDEADLTNLEDFKKEFETAKLFDEKIIAITVAGFRAGINFGQEMKELLIATWDSTIANIAAVVQANIGRACGYHHNIHAKHYTNLDAISAYSELLNHLESSDNSDNFDGLQQLFERICQQYDIAGFDRGTEVRPEPATVISRKIDDSLTYQTAQYCVVSAKLEEANPNFSEITQDTDFLEAIALIRQEYLKDGAPYVKAKRALRGEHQNWIKAQWVNGVSYDNFNLSNHAAKPRTLDFITRLKNGDAIAFNEIVNPGGGEATKDKRIAASIFSIYNTSSQLEQFKRKMSLEDVHEMCDALNTERDNTVIVLFKRGEFDQTTTDKKAETLEQSRIKHRSVFNS